MCTSVGHKEVARRVRVDTTTADYCARVDRALLTSPTLVAAARRTRPRETATAPRCRRRRSRRTRRRRGRARRERRRGGTAAPRESRARSSCPCCSSAVRSRRTARTSDVRAATCARCASSRAGAGGSFGGGGCVGSPWLVAAQIAARMGAADRFRTLCGLCLRGWAASCVRTARALDLQMEVTGQSAFFC